MELWWGKLSFEGMPAFRDPDDGMIWVWDSESKTYTKKQEVDQPDRGHQTGGDNNLFDPVQHTEWPGVPELEGHMASIKWPACPNCRQTAGFDTYPFARGYLQCNNCAHLATAQDLAELYHLGPNPHDDGSFPSFWNDKPDSRQQTLAAWDDKPAPPSRDPQFLDYEIQRAEPGSEYLGCPNCEFAMSYADSQALESANQPWDRCPRCGEEMYDWADAQAEENYYRELDNDQAPGDYEMYGPDQITWADIQRYESKTSQEFVPEGQVKCPNCEQTTDMPQCPYCMKDLTPEWNKEQQKIDFLSQPHNVNSEFTSWPDREPKRNREKTDDSYPSMISKVAAWGDEAEVPQEENLPIHWNPPAPGTSFEEIEAMLEQYGKGRRPGQNRRKVGNNSWLERREDGSIALRLHNTDVVRWYPDRIVMDTGGWHSRTTRDRMNWWIPGDVWTNRGTMFYLPPNRDPYANKWDKEYQKSNLVDWYDQMTTDYEGNVLPKEEGQAYRDGYHYVSNYDLAVKLAHQRMSQDEWDRWFTEGPSLTEVGKWIQDQSGQLHWDTGSHTDHGDISRRNGIDWPSGVAALGSVYSDGTADIQRIFPGAAVDPSGIQQQLESTFGPLQLKNLVSTQGAEDKGATFQPVVITSGQFVMPSQTLPVTGQAWVRERPNGIPYHPDYVLVAEHLMTDDFELYANGSKAIVTATGALTSHAAQLATTDNIPVVVGIGPDYNKIETGNYLKIDPARQDITVLPYVQPGAAPEQNRQVYDQLKQYDRARNPQYYENSMPTFSHFHEELAWKEANGPQLDSCPECDAPMAERDSTKFCPDCGHKQPIITTQAAEKTAFLPALGVGAAALLGRLGLSAGAAAAGQGAASGGMGALMRSALSPKNLLMGQGIRSMLPGGNSQPQAPVMQQMGPQPGVQQYGMPGQPLYIGSEKVAIELGDPEEEEIYLPEPKPLVAPVPSPKPEREKEKEKEKEREKVPASVKKADTFGEEEIGRGTKNRGEDSDPEHDGSGANFEEKGDSPELLKDVDGEGNAKNDPDQDTPQKQQHGGDPKKALELFDTNLPLILEFATSDQDGSTHPILVAIDEMLESAFPGYKDLMEDVEELTGEDYDSDNEEGEPEEHQEAVEEASDDSEKVAAVGDLWHFGFETAPLATPAPTAQVPGQAGTCQLCGQSHMPGTPCPTSGVSVMQQPTAVGAPITPLQPNKVVTYVDDYGDFEDENHFDAPNGEIDDNTRRVEADSSHLRHQHEDDLTEGFAESVERLDPDVDNNDIDPELGEDGVWVDENGDPLQEGQNYELKSNEYAIPDRVTIERIDGDEMVFTIHSGDVDYRDSLTRDDMETFGYSFSTADTDGVDSISQFEMEEDPIRPGDDGFPQEDDLTEPATVVSRLDNYTGSFHGDNPSGRGWLMGGGGVDVDPDLMAKFAGKDYSPREQREFIDEQGTARNLDKLDLDGTHYVMDDELGTGDSLW